MSERERRLRLGAYAVVLRDDELLLSRLAPRVVDHELWTLPGGGVDHGEHPRDAVVREVHEETGLEVTVGETVRVHDVRYPAMRADDGTDVDAHSVRLVYEGWVAKDAPAPRVVEVDGSTSDAAWHPLPAVLDGTVPVADLVTEALAAHSVARLQRLAAYALVRRRDPEPAVLLTRIGDRGHHAGAWTLPGGGVEHGEAPRDAVRREVREETGLEVEVGAVLDVDDLHLRGTAPSGRDEDFHGVHLVFAATPVGASGEPRVVEVDGTTSAVAWVSERDVDGGALEVLDVVRVALAAGRAGSASGAAQYQPKRSEWAQAPCGSP